MSITSGLAVIRAQCRENAFRQCRREISGSRSSLLESLLYSFDYHRILTLINSLDTAKSDSLWCSVSIRTRRFAIPWLRVISSKGTEG
jgi:hypothetical protein